MGNFDINKFLIQAVQKNASDIHLKEGEYVAVRIDGAIIKSGEKQLDNEDMKNVLNAITPDTLRNNIYNLQDSDFSYEIKGVSRFRVNVSKSLNIPTVTIRVIPYKIRNFKELNLPNAIEKIASFENGIILVTGVAGSGKSTTIASLLEYININYPKHIITIEDPVEYLFDPKKSIITQRQIGIDTPTFLDGLKYALRQDPNVILIGEIRDGETVRSALRAAETGHLVVATMHTIDSIQTINRLLSFFDPVGREYIREQFASVFRATISQKLLPKIDNIGRVPACEILVTTPTVKDFIEKNELNQIYHLISNGSYDDMCTFNMSLYNLIKNNIISDKVALEFSDNKNELMRLLKGVYSGTAVTHNKIKM